MRATYPTNPVTTSTKSYDFRNNVIDETDQRGNITHHIYDLSGRQTSITKGYNTPQASATSFTYYDDGRKYTETDALNHTTTYIYDAAGRLTSIAGPKGNFTYAYDAAGNRISSADGNGNTTSFQYDARKRLVKTVYPDTHLHHQQLRWPGQPRRRHRSRRARSCGTLTIAANQLQTVIQLNHPNPSNNTNTYGYDPLGNLTALTDENLHTTQNVFDLFNEPVSKTLPIRRSPRRASTMRRATSSRSPTSTASRRLILMTRRTGSSRNRLPESLQSASPTRRQASTSPRRLATAR